MWGWEGRRAAYPPVTLMPHTQGEVGSQLLAMQLFLTLNHSLREANELDWFNYLLLRKILMLNTRRGRKSVRLGSHHLGEWSHSLIDKQMLGWKYSKWRDPNIPSQEELEPNSVLKFSFFQLAWPSSLSPSIAHILQVVLLFVFEKIDLYICTENTRAFSS